MPNSFAANAFANNFITGFQFVDQIKANKRNEQRLNQRLEEERQERSFQRRRTLERDTQVREDRGFVAQERTRQAKERADIKEASRLALNPDSTNEELLSFAHVPQAAAELKRRIGEEKFTEAVREFQTIGGVGVPSNGATQPLGGGAKEDQVLSQPVDQQPVRDNAFGFGPNRGVSGLEVVEEEEFNRFSTAFQEKGFFATGADVVAGQVAQTKRAGRDVIAGALNAPGRIRASITGEDINPATQNVGQEFTGRVNLPGEFTTTTEFEELNATGDSAAIREAADKNREITADYERRGALPQSFSRTARSRQGAVLVESDAARRNAIAAENSAIKVAQDFLDPAQTSLLGELAQSDPKLAAVAYLDIRATIEGKQPRLAVDMDRRMVSVLNEAEVNMQNELISKSPGSPEFRRQMASLGQLQRSRDEVAGLQPSIARQAGVRSQGLNIGNAEMTSKVTDAMYDSNQPGVGYQPPSALNAAATVAGRISPRRRLNDAQIQALYTLKPWLDKPTITSVMMTGAFPPGKDPNAIKSLQKAGNTVYALHEGGSVSVLPQASGGKIPSQELTEEGIGFALAGAMTKFPDMDERRQGQFVGLLIDHADWIRQRYVMSSEEQMNQVGRYFGQMVSLSDAELNRREDSFWATTTNSPSPEDLFMSPELAGKVAADLGIDLIEVKPVRSTSGLNLEEAKQRMRAGDFGFEASQAVDSLDEKQVFDVILRWKYQEALREQAAQRQ